MSIELRPPKREDAADVADALNRFSRAFGMPEETTSGIENWFAAPSADIENDARVAVLDGEIVGYADVSDSTREGRFLWIDTGFDPAHPDVVAPLLDFTEERARQLAAPGGAIRAGAPEPAAGLRKLLESRGFAFHHFSLRMAADVTGELPEPVWPGGISGRRFRGPDDEQAVYGAHQETFADQRDFEPDPFEDWQYWSYRDPFDPELWFLALDGEQIAGIALCRSEWGGDTDFGWVSVLGVRRPWRRRGLGLALLQHAFRELRARGKSRVGLGVDAENPTGAVRLYERGYGGRAQAHLVRQAGGLGWRDVAAPRQVSGLPDTDGRRPRPGLRVSRLRAGVRCRSRPRSARLG